MNAENGTAVRRRKAERIIVALGAPMCVFLAAWYIRSGGNEIKCVFYELTGLYCPGCGSGRALGAVLKGDLAAAFSYNCMLFFLGIPCLAVLMYEYVRIVFPGLHRKPVRVPRAVTVFLAVFLAAFWILRNLPAFSFLAPGS